MRGSKSALSHCQGGHKLLGDPSQPSPATIPCGQQQATNPNSFTPEIQIRVHAIWFWFLSQYVAEELVNAGESKAISEQPPEECRRYQGEGARYPSASAVREESETQGSPQDTSQTRAGVFVGLISDQSHTLVPSTNTQVKSDAISFN